MRRLRLVVPWPNGLHMRPAMRLVQLAQKFRSQISLRNGSHVADARSILSILLLCAALNSPLDVVVTGADEDQAAVALQELFSQATCAGTVAGTRDPWFDEPQPYDLAANDPETYDLTPGDLDDRELPESALDDEDS